MGRSVGQSLVAKGTGTARGAPFFPREHFSDFVYQPSQTIFVALELADFKPLLIGLERNLCEQFCALGFFSLKVFFMLGLLSLDRSYFRGFWLASASSR